MKLKNFSKSAFTLIELIMVLGIAAVLLAVSLSGFYFLRDSISVSNAAQGMKAAIRDAQDKALTYSVYENDTSTARSTAGYQPYWVYGYSFEYDTTNNQYVLYSIQDTSIQVSDPNIDINLIKTNTTSLKSVWATGNNNSNCHNPSNKIAGFNTADCIKQTAYDLVADIHSGSTPCSLLFTTVNASSFINGGAPDCTIQFDRSLKKQTVYFVKSNSAVGEVKICNDLVSSC